MPLTHQRIQLMMHFSYTGAHRAPSYLCLDLPFSPHALYTLRNITAHISTSLAYSGLRCVGEYRLNVSPQGRSLIQQSSCNEWTTLASSVHQTMDQCLHQRLPLFCCKKMEWKATGLHSRWEIPAKSNNKTSEALVENTVCSGLKLLE